MVKSVSYIFVPMAMLLMLSCSAFRVINGRRVNKVSESKTSESRVVSNSSKLVSQASAKAYNEPRCQVRMGEPYQGFRYSFPVPVTKTAGPCLRCNAFQAMESMPLEMFVGVQCGGPTDKNEVCRRVSKTRSMWSKFCACAFQKDDGPLKPALAFPGVQRNGNACGAQACWDTLVSIQERRARALGSDLTFGHNAIDKVQLIQGCTSCASGALPPEKQRECTEHRLGLGTDSGGTSENREEEWIRNGELGSEDDSDEEDIDDDVEDTEGVVKEPVEAPHEVSVGTNMSTQVDFPQPPADAEKLLKRMLEEQKKLYEDLLRQLRGELGQARLDLSTQAELAKNNCFHSISELRKQIKDSEASSCQKERLRLIDSHKIQIDLLTKNLAATGSADKAALEAQFNKLLLEAKNLCSGEKQALTEQLQSQCQADSSATELRIRTELDASCQDEIKLKVQANDEEWKKKETIWIESNKAYEQQAVDAKGKQAEAEDQWRKINAQLTLEVTARQKLEELLKSEREAWARERKALEDQVTSAKNSAAAHLNMQVRLQKTCDEEKNRTSDEYKTYLGQFRAACESQIKMCSDQKADAIKAVTAAEERCNQQIALIVEHNSASISMQTFDIRWNNEVKRQEENCEAAKKEQYSQLERQCGETIQMKVETTRTEEFSKYQALLQQERTVWAKECETMQQTQKDAWLAQAKTEYDQGIANIQAQCNTQLESQLAVQTQLQTQIQTIYAAGMKEYERAEACIVEGQTRIAQAEESVSLCKSQGTQIIIQMKATLQEAQVQSENRLQENIASLTLKHQQETALLTQSNHECQQQLADQGKLTELIDAQHKATNQECLQQTQTLTVQLSDAKKTIEDAKNSWNALNVEFNQCKSYASTCDQERTTIKTERDASVTHYKTQLEQCIQAAQTQLGEQAQTAKDEKEALEQRYITALSQHQDRYNEEVQKHQHDRQQCQEQINIVNAQSRELTIQYKAAMDSYRAECHEYVEKERTTTEEKYTQQHTQAMQQASSQYTQIKTQLEKQLSDCVNGLNENNATAKQQLITFQEQVSQARSQIKAEQDRFQACFNEGTKIYNQFEASKEEWARKEKVSTDTYNQCMSAGLQLEKSKSVVEDQLSQCTQQLQGAAQMLEQAQAPQGSSGDMPMPICPICYKYCSTPDVRLKVYKGGQFLPEHGGLPFTDPNKRAPRGGCVCCLAPGSASFLQMATKSISA